MLRYSFSPDFKLKRPNQSKKSSQGHGKPLVANHKLDHVNHTSKTAGGTSSSSYKSQHSSDIKFYHSFEPYYDFTNFADYPIRLDGKLWPTTEHYFQAQKFIGTPYEEAIRRQPSARGAFDMSRNPSVSHWRRGDWDQVKTDIMLKCLRAKFTQYKKLGKLLLDTGDRKLVEHTFNDFYWGDGGDGSGQNKLGRLLMQVRRELLKVKGNDVPSSTMPHQSSSTYNYLKNDLYKDFSAKEKERTHSGSSSHRHRRRNSCSGSLVTTIHSLSPEPEHDVKRVKHKRSGSLSNLSTLSGSTTDHGVNCQSSVLREKFRSVENLSQLSQSSEKQGLNSQCSFEEKSQPPKRLHTRSSSYGDLSQHTRNKHFLTDNHTRYYTSGKGYWSWTTINSVNSKQRLSMANQSSVGYDIVTHMDRGHPR